MLPTIYNHYKPPWLLFTICSDPMCHANVNLQIISFHITIHWLLPSCGNKQFPTPKTKTSHTFLPFFVEETQKYFIKCNNTLCNLNHINFLHFLIDKFTQSTVRLFNDFPLKYHTSTLQSQAILPSSSVTHTHLQKRALDPNSNITTHRMP
jgi:hypothetical protein